MKKKIKTISLISMVLILTLLNIFKIEFVYYLPFNIPGSQMAITLPPFGIFIESTYKKEEKNPCSVYQHEKIHWIQYQRMGLFKFYYTYLNLYLKSGRIYNWMEEEARMPCKTKKIN